MKSLLWREDSSFLRLVAGEPIESWVQTELRQIETRRIDFAARLKSGKLLHIEFQSTNESRMAWRMLDYALALERAERCLPRQIVLYFGKAPLSMPSRIEEGELRFAHQLIDVRHLEAPELLLSPHIEDRLLAALCGNVDLPSLISAVTELGDRLTPEKQRQLFRQAMVLCGLRPLEPLVEELKEHMPIIINEEDISYYRTWKAKGRAEGLQEGRQEGLRAGQTAEARKNLLTILRVRFGPVPGPLSERIDSAELGELESLIERAAVATSIDEIL